MPFQADFTLNDGVFSVTTTADSGPGSLRQAILDSDIATGGINTIDFAIPGQGIETIAPLSPLPAITNPVLIDGFSQPGYAGSPLIELTGSQSGAADGLTITGSDISVCGLDLNGFSQGAGILISGPNATANWIYGNVIGTDPTGTQAEPNLNGVQVIDGGTRQHGRHRPGRRRRLAGNQPDQRQRGRWCRDRLRTAPIMAKVSPAPPARSRSDGSASINDGSLELTDGNYDEAASAFYGQPVNVAAFATQFQFQLDFANADGFTFTIQGDGPNALGESGGDLGYGGSPGIGESVAVKFDLYSNSGEGPDSTGLYIDGARRPCRRRT